MRGISTTSCSGEMRTDSLSENELGSSRILRFERSSCVTLCFALSTSFVAAVRSFEGEIAGERIDQGERGGVAFQREQDLNLRACGELVLSVQAQNWRNE